MEAWRCIIQTIALTEVQMRRSLVLYSSYQCSGSSSRLSKSYSLNAEENQANLGKLSMK
jgi:hypothetical protein